MSKKDKEKAQVPEEETVQTETAAENQGEAGQAAAPTPPSWPPPWPRPNRP